MKKGFTLIELLAVIVILAIIATIATPIVLSIIEDTKESALFRSADYYLSALETSIATATLKNQDIKEGTYNILENGNICLEGYVENTKTCSNELAVEVKGEKPSIGTITFANGKITDVDLTLSNKRLVKNSNGEIIYFPCTLLSGNKTTPGSKYECEVKPGVKYNFYVLSTEEDGTTNLIMDRNICEDGTPTEEGKKCFVAYNEDGDAADVGPVTAMDFLNNATSTWENIDNLNITYDDEGENFTDFALNGKARLPYYSEVSGYSASANNAYLFDNLNLDCYDSADYYNPVACDEAGYIEGVYEKGIENIDGISGYWTLSSSAYGSDSAWFVFWVGFLDYSYVDRDTFYGARPVINLKI